MGFWKRTGWIGLALLGLIASLALQVLMGLAGGVLAAVMSMISGMAEGLTGANLQAYLETVVMDGAVWGVLGYHVISLPIFGLWYYFGCGRRKPVNPARIFTVRRVLTILVGSLGLCVLANGMVLAEEFITPGLFAQYMELMEAAGFGVSVLTMIASVLLAPIGEEILCRGIILHYCRRAAAGIGTRKMSFWIANVIQALIFGIMHANFVQGSYAFVLGLGLGYLRYRYDSLYPSMLAHFLINFLSTFVMGFLLAWVPESLFGAALLLLLGVGVTVVSIVLGREKQDCK